MAPLLEPERYSKFFVRKDWDDGHYPKELFNPKVTYGGRAFSPNYVALDPKIEHIVPDTHIYDKYANLYKGNLKMAFNVMVKAIHLRATYDNINIAEDIMWKINRPTRGATSIVFHDYDLANFSNSLEIINNVIKEREHRTNEKVYIGAKFPIQISTNEEFIKWLSFKTLVNFYTLQLNNILNEEAFNLLL